MSLLALSGTNSAVAGGYDIANSCKFEDDNDEWLYRTNATGTNRRTWTVSWWFKQTELRSVNGAATEMWHGGAFGEATRIGIFADDRLWIDIGGGTGNTGILFRSLSTQKIRDTSAWYHFVIACDTTQSTEADRLKVWLNGEEVTAWDQRQYPTLNYECAVQAGIQMRWGSYDANYHGFSGYLAECNYVDGVTATQNDFGEFDEDSGIWKPKEYEGSYGTNGSYLDFEIASDLGANAKGNDVNFSLNNITAADQATDTPTNNFCTINALVGTDSTISEGATKFKNHATNGWESFVASMGAGTSGKWYAEFKFVDSDNDNMIGISPIDDPDLNRGFATSFAYYGSDTSLDESIGYYGSDGARFIGGGPASYGNSYARTNIMSIAVDMDNGKLYFAKDGVWQNSGDPTSGATGTGALDVRGATKPQSLGASVYYANESILANYGGYTTISISTPETDENGYGTFEYAPPSGYYALCTKNLAEYG
jgi:hypothetical protein